MDRQPVEHPPDQWAGETVGMHIRHGGDPIPVTVKVTWDDGLPARSTRGRSNGPSRMSASIARQRRRITRSGCEPAMSGGAELSVGSVGLFVAR